MLSTHAKATGWAARKWVLGFFLTVALLGVPHGAMAGQSTNDDDAVPPDGRLQNYEKPVELQSTSTALTWLLLIVLGVVSMGVLFKDAKRTHLD